MEHREQTAMSKRLALRLVDSDADMLSEIERLAEFFMDRLRALPPASPSRREIEHSLARYHALSVGSAHRSV